MEEDYREEAVIAAPGTETFREFVLFAHSGNRLLDKDGNLIKTTEQGMEPGEEGGHEAPDHEDTGEKGYNYRSERFFNRLQRVRSEPLPLSGLRLNGNLRERPCN